LKSNLQFPCFTAIHILNCHPGCGLNVINAAAKDFYFYYHPFITRRAAFDLNLFLCYNFLVIQQFIYCISVIFGDMEPWRQDDTAQLFCFWSMHFSPWIAGASVAPWL